MHTAREYPRHEYVGKPTIQKAAEEFIASLGYGNCVMLERNLGNVQGASDGLIALQNALIDRLQDVA